MLNYVVCLNLRVILYSYPWPLILEFYTYVYRMEYRATETSEIRYYGIVAWDRIWPIQDSRYVSDRYLYRCTYSGTAPRPESLVVTRCGRMLPYGTRETRAFFLVVPWVLPYNVFFYVSWYMILRAATIGNFWLAQQHHISFGKIVWIITWIDDEQQKIKNNKTITGAHY